MDKSSPNAMTVDQARKVMWLRNNFRPLGELLDEGFLTEKRLEWAAAKAQDLSLRQAAQVLLDWQKGISKTPGIPKPLPKPAELLNASPSVVAITLEQARATVWPFRPYKGQPMG